MSEPFIMTFDAPGDFGAYRDACAWLAERGYIYGSLCSPMPTAILYGDFSIAKWKNLTAKERREVDGTLTSQSFRDGPVTLSLKERPR